MDLFARIRTSVWILLIGLVGLYAFFVLVASVPPGEVLILSCVVAAMAVMFLVHNMRVAHELDHPGGDPRLRRNRNEMRERRGF